MTYDFRWRGRDFGREAEGHDTYYFPDVPELQIPERIKRELIAGRPTLSDVEIFDIRKLDTSCPRCKTPNAMGDWKEALEGNQKTKSVAYGTRSCVKCGYTEFYTAER